MSGTIRAAVHFLVCLDSVTHDFASAIRTYRGQRVNRALKAVKDMSAIFYPNLKRFVVFVTTHFTLSHAVLALTQMSSAI